MNESDRNQIMEVLLGLVDHISDKEYQKRAWIQGEEADFDETVCLFFGDCDPVLEDYQAFGITDLQHDVLKRFRDEFRGFSDENDFPEEFIDTPEWDRIVRLAKEVLNAFSYEEKS